MDIQTGIGVIILAATVFVAIWLNFNALKWFDKARNPSLVGIKRYALAVPCSAGVLAGIWGIISIVLGVLWFFSWIVIYIRLALLWLIEAVFAGWYFIF